MDRIDRMQRPIFDDRQVMSFEDLEIGGLYEMTTGAGTDDESSYELVLTSQPYVNAYGHWEIKYRSYLGAIPCDSHIYLSDAGVIPYCEGFWNRTNYMVLKAWFGEVRR